MTSSQDHSLVLACCHLVQPDVLQALQVDYHKHKHAPAGSSLVEGWFSQHMTTAAIRQTGAKPTKKETGVLTVMCWHHNTSKRMPEQLV